MLLRLAQMGAFLAAASLCATAPGASKHESTKLGGNLLVGLTKPSANLAVKAAQGIGRVDSKDRVSQMFRIKIDASVGHERAIKLLRDNPSVRFVLEGDASSVDAHSLPSVKRHVEYLKAVKELSGEDEDRNEAKSKENESSLEYWEAYQFWLEDRVNANGVIDTEGIRKAVEHRNQMPAAHLPPALSGGWSFMGPSNLDTPYEIYFGKPPINGRVNAVAVHPTNSNIIYLGGADGGLWKTTDGGLTWSPKSDGWDYMNVSAIAIDPTNPNVVYVGTGDYQGELPYCMGVMKSTDGGATWTNYGRADFGNNAVSKLVIDPENHLIVTITTGRGSNFGGGGVWQSTDAGVTWHLRNPPADDWTDLDYSIKDGQGNRVYWAVGSGSTGVNVWKSVDRGSSWTQVTAPNTDNNETVSVACSKLTAGTLWVLLPQSMKIYKSTTTGASWNDVSAGFPTGNSNYNWSQGWYDYYIRATTVTNGTTTDGIYVGLITIAFSPDGGASWTDLSKTYTGSALAHADQHTMMVDPSDPTKAYAGNDGGLFRVNYSPGLNTATFDPLNKALGITQFYKMATDPTDANYAMGGAQDNSTPAAFGDLTHWNNVGAGDGGFCEILQSNRLIQYDTSQFLSVAMTTDGWTNVYNDITPNIGSDSVAFIAPIALSSDGTLYAGSNYLYSYNGSTWSSHLGGQVLADSGNYIRTIATAPSDPNRVYTGSYEQLWMSTNKGTNWTKLNAGSAPLPATRIVYISPSPTNPDDLLIACTTTGVSHVWHCTNVSASDATRVWVDVSGTGVTGLPDIPFNTIARDPYTPATTWYAGSDIGLFMTTNGGSTWTNMTEPLGLPNVQVNDLKVAHGFLYAATFGRGMWRIPVVNLAMLKLTPASNTVVGGSPLSCTATLNGYAPAGGAAVALTSSNTNVATVPASVTVPENTDHVGFTITTKTVASDTQVTITGTYGGVSKAALITVSASSWSGVLTSLTVNPSQVVGGVSTLGTVTLSQAAPTGGKVVTLSDNSSALGTPASVTVLAGNTLASFTITTAKVSVTSVRQVTAVLDAVTKTANVTLTPGLKSLTVSPSQVVGGANTTGTVTLLGPAPTGGTSVTLTDNSTALTTPPFVSVPAGATSANFTIGTAKVAATAIRQVTASLGTVTVSASITLTPGLKDLTLNPPSVVGGSNSTGTVTLLGPAPAGGQVVTITSGSSIIHVPPTVTVPAGATSVNFTVGTSTVTATYQRPVTATLAGVSVTKYLTVHP